MMEDNTLRLVYIHGFQGDHTSFQSFPTDLHECLRARVPAGFALESCLYPTYKSRKPISEAAKKFIGWLSTQPPGPVILLAHSMGGLLAAEVAIADSEQSKRVIGLVAFDVPFLGMHPHVIISGIASLLPGDKEDKEKTEAEMNDENIVKQVHSDDVESAKSASIDNSSASNKDSQPLRPPLTHHSSSSFSSQVDDEWEAMKSSLQPPTSNNRSQTNLSPPSPYGSAPPSTRSSSTSLVSSITSTSTSYILSRVPPLASPLTAKLERTAERIVGHHTSNSNFADSRLMRWLRKHADDPVSAMTRWVVEHFEFGVCMFDPAGLGERYRVLERWEGRWVNFWTEVPKRGRGSSSGVKQAEEEEEEEVGKMGKEADEDEDENVKGVLPNNTADVLQFADLDGQASQSEARKQAKARKEAERALRKERAKERRHGTSSSSVQRPARHFIVLPHIRYAVSEKSSSWHFGSGERWERVQLGNVEDEVAAHCGLFIKQKNLEYEELVQRVAGVVEGWCREKRLV